MKKYAWVLIPLVFLFIACAKAETPGMSSEDYPDAPEFIFEDLNGNKISLSDLSGKVVFLNVWATWCSPCTREIPDFVEVYKQYKDNGLEIIGISVDRISQSRVLKFAEKYKINYPLVMITSKLYKDYGPFPAIPVTIIIDKNRKIRNRKIGMVNRGFVESWFLKLIEEK